MPDVTQPPTTTTNPRNAHIIRAVQMMIQRGEEKRVHAVQQLSLLHSQLSRQEQQQSHEQQQLNSNPMLRLYHGSSTATDETSNALRIMFTVLSCVLSNGTSIDFGSLNVGSDDQLLQLISQVNPRQLSRDCYDKLNAYFNIHLYPALFPDETETMNGTEFVRYGGMLGHFMFLFVDSTFTVLKGLKLQRT